ncbi:MAG: hypothetical protein J0L78_11440 [Planctomycetes bacterium]|nr:hypothetical protein [Planctomycetota bacterium]
MRLPGPLFDAVRLHMSWHGDWHYARLNPAAVGRDGQAIIERARVRFPDAICMVDEGSGEQFLTFHRHMLRHYKWIVQNTPVPGYVFDMWDELPPWVTARLGAEYMAGFEAALAELLAGPSLDELGAFLESTPRAARRRFHGVHELCHVAIVDIEAEQYPSDERRRDASMGDMKLAHYNEHFWSLHHWIDSLYSAWQIGHGIVPNVSPLRPDHGH